MSYSENLKNLEDYMRSCHNIYDTICEEYKRANECVLLMKSPMQNWKVIQRAAMSWYLEARLKKDDRQKSWARGVALSMLKQKRYKMRSLYVWPVKHFCKDCGTTSKGPFLIGGQETRKSFCRNDECPTQWWNKPQFSPVAEDGVFEAAKIMTMFHVEQLKQGE